MLLAISRILGKNGLFGLLLLSAGTKDLSVLMLSLSMLISVLTLEEKQLEDLVPLPQDMVVFGTQVSTDRCEVFEQLCPQWVTRLNRVCYAL